VQIDISTGATDTIAATDQYGIFIAEKIVRPGFRQAQRQLLEIQAWCIATCRCRT
jgi:hypothetical protein